MKLKRISGVLYGIGQFVNRFYLRRLNLEIKDENAPRLDKPYIIFANHSSVMDYRLTSFLLRKSKPYHVAAKNQFAGRRRLMYKIGALPKVQFLPDVALVRDIERAVKLGKSVVIFPEGVVSFDGTNRELPFSAAKLVRHLGVGVAVIKIKGSYLVKPRFNEVFHKSGKTEVEFFGCLSAEQVKAMSVDEIHGALREALRFDVWEWNLKNNVATKGDLSVGMDNLLYECAVCGGKTAVKDGRLVCGKCGSAWNVDKYYRLAGCGEFNIHEWFEIQRRRAAEAAISGEFRMEEEVSVMILDGFRGFKKAGNGRYIHGADGVRFTGEIGGQKTELFFDGAKYPSAPAGNDFIEFTLRGVTYRFYFKTMGAAIKSVLHAEEIFKIKNKKRSR